MACEHKFGVYSGMDGYASFVYCLEDDDERECGKEVEYFDFCPDCGQKLSEVEMPETREW